MNGLGLAFRARNRTGEGLAEAWVSTNGGVTLVLHSTEFASWWDETGPQPSPGGAQVDFDLESAKHLDATFVALATAGGGVIKHPTDMPWGQRFAIVLDPDGHRVGIKASRQHR
jgi:catechol 2,3-dioxygenase-like lactoylglutathione lyase family enzyme